MNLEEFTITVPSYLKTACVANSTLEVQGLDNEWSAYRHEGKAVLVADTYGGSSTYIAEPGTYRFNFESLGCDTCTPMFAVVDAIGAGVTAGGGGNVTPEDEFDVVFSHHEYCDQNPADQNDVIEYVEVFMVRVNSTQGTIASTASLGYFLHEDMTEPYVPRGAAQVECEELANVVLQSDLRRTVLTGPAINRTIDTTTAVLSVGYAVQAIGDENNLPTIVDGEGNVSELYPNESGSWGADSEAPSRYFQTLPKFNLNAGDVIVITWTEARTN